MTAVCLMHPSKVLARSAFNVCHVQYAARTARTTSERFGDKKQKNKSIMPN
jgi:hypothetical protein